MKTYSGLAHLYGKPLAAIDFETTGDRPGYHEIIQIAVVPLNSDFESHPDIPPFYMNIAPEFPHRALPEAMAQNKLDLDQLMVEAPSLEKVTTLFEEWFDRIDLPVGKNFVPLAHNWAFESMWLTNWLGPSMKSKIFHGHARDPMVIAGYLNDRAAYAGEDVPFTRLSLTSMAEKLKVVNERPHDALHDCLTAAKIYKTLVTFGID